MKKLIAVLTALTLVIGMTAALAEGNAAPAFIGGVQFNMDMNQVMQLLKLPNPEMEKEYNRGVPDYSELEYENVTGDDGHTADIRFSFAGGSLVAIHLDMADGTPYEDIKADLSRVYGAAVPFNAAKIGNARYVIDDDGDLKNCKEMIEADGVTIVLEQERDGDIDVTFFDPAAAYLSN